VTTLPCHPEERSDDREATAQPRISTPISQDVGTGAYGRGTAPRPSADAGYADLAVQDDKTSLSKY
jgi:hypothetical protein